MYIWKKSRELVKNWLSNVYLLMCNLITYLTCPIEEWWNPHMIFIYLYILLNGRNITVESNYQNVDNK